MGPLIAAPTPTAPRQDSTATPYIATLAPLGVPWSIAVSVRVAQRQFGAPTGAAIFWYGVLPAATALAPYALLLSTL